METVNLTKAIDSNKRLNNGASWKKIIESDYQQPASLSYHPSNHKQS